jgi:hypothetical protein
LDAGQPRGSTSAAWFGLPARNPGGATNWGLAAIGLGGAVVIGMVAWFEAQSIGAEVLAASWVVPITAALLVFQLWLSAVAWRIAMDVDMPRLSRVLRIRWIREAVNSLLPVARLGGNLVGIQLLAQRRVRGYWPPPTPCST